QHVCPPLEELAHDLRADGAGAAGDENGHAMLAFFQKPEAGASSACVLFPAGGKPPELVSAWEHGEAAAPGRCLMTGCRTPAASLPLSTPPTLRNRQDSGRPRPVCRPPGWKNARPTRWRWRGWPRAD